MAKAKVPTELVKTEETLDMTKPLQFVNRLSISLDDLTEGILFKLADEFKTEIKSFDTEYKEYLKSLEKPEIQEYFRTKILSCLDFDINPVEKYLKDSHPDEEIIFDFKYSSERPKFLTAVGSKEPYPNHGQILHLEIPKSSRKSLETAINKSSYRKEYKKFISSFEKFKLLATYCNVLVGKYDNGQIPRRVLKQMCKATIVQNKALSAEDVLKVALNKIREYIFLEDTSFCGRVHLTENIPAWITKG